MIDRTETKISSTKKIVFQDNKKDNIQEVKAVILDSIHDLKRCYEIYTVPKVQW